MGPRTHLTTMTFLTLLTLLGSLPLAAKDETDKKNEEKARSTRSALIERHERAAEIHRKAADCLKSNKSSEECLELMQDQCGAMMKDNDYCPMMGGMGWMMKDRGHMRTHRAWHEEQKNTAPKKKAE